MNREKKQFMSHLAELEKNETSSTHFLLGQLFSSLIALLSGPNFFVSLSFHLCVFIFSGQAYWASSMLGEYIYIYIFDLPNSNILAAPKRSFAQIVAQRIPSQR